MSACPHTSRVFVPKEDDPDVMLDVCLQCGEIQGVSTPDDLEELGASLGDPDEDDDWQDDWTDWHDALHKDDS